MIPAKDIECSHKHHMNILRTLLTTMVFLQDLILEKKSLQKEMNRLKQLNSHLENRLQDQGRRLGLVSSELGKTWHVVGRMERQHQQLHTHEKILRYELQQKRKLLTELKEELEYCKDKWDRAKQKNCESQIEWDKLRIEFASRKIKSNESINNSVESGYSDERVSDEDSDVSDGGIVSERKRLKKKSKSAETDAVDNGAIKDAEEAVDSDILQDEEVASNDGIEVTSEGEIQANLADTEDQSASEVLSKNGENSEEESTVNSPGEPVATSSSSTPNNGTCYDDVLATRSARLKKLEEQCYVLVNKVTKTKIKGVQLCNRLEELHNQYGGGAPEQPSTSSQTTTEEDGNPTSDRLESNEKDTNIGQEEILPVLRVNDLIIDATATDESVKENSDSNVRLDCIEKDAKLVVEEIQTALKESSSDEVTPERLSEETVEENGLDTKTDDVQVGAESLTEKYEENIPTKETTDTEEITTSSVPGKSTISDFESRFAARDERLKRMEEQAKSLVSKVSNTSTRSVAICSRLDELHNTYGKSEEQPDGAADKCTSDGQSEEADCVADKCTSDSQPSTSNITNGETVSGNTEMEIQTSINNSTEQRIEEQK